MEQQPLTLGVSDFIALVNQTLEYAYPSVVIEGELSSFKLSKGKFVFFDLKDDQSAVSCFMMSWQLRTPLEDGMKVRVVAVPKLTAWGKFSLTVRDIRPVGEGDIKKSFKLLLAKLQKEGLFDESRKRRLPHIPQRVGLIASTESAGYADFIKILNGRWGGLDVQVADVQVQGANAAPQIMRAITYFNEHAQPVDVLVVVRGGGSAEDLAVFNEEPLVRTIAASRIPTMVGVGHEVDTSLADLAADVRAATPSNAAQLLVPDREAVIRDIRHKQRRMLAHIVARQQGVERQIAASTKHMLARMQRRVAEQRRHVQYAQRTLRQFDPKVVLARGYAIVRDEAGKLVQGRPVIKTGSAVTIETSHATINAGVTNVQSKP